MDLNPYITGGFGVACTLLGVLITYRLARKLADANASHAARQAEANALRDAKAKLRAAFAPAIANIYLARHHGTHDTPVVGDILKSALLAHASAIEEFRPFVPDIEGKAYQRAWEEYRAFIRQDNEIIDSAEWHTDAERWSGVEVRIDAILVFAKS